MSTILRFLLSLGLFAVGLVFAASVLVASMLLMALWGVRALWLTLTGRPVAPFRARFRPRASFRSSRAPSSANDVIDVEAKRLP
jgi:hypothetical protein